MQRMASKASLLGLAGRHGTRLAGSVNSQVLSRQPASMITVRSASSSSTSPASYASSPSEFAGNPASRPYARHRPALPNPKSYKVPALLFILFSLGSWSAFTIHAMNRERLSSSVLKNVTDKLKGDQRVIDKLGEDVALEREMLLAGDPWINGSVNMMQGRIDISFRVRGAKDSGKIYFTSIRREQSEPYETVRFLLILDANKQTISLLDD